ncbi:hypothetical protein CFBP1573P_05678 [Pseudomonas syringae pv. persicae]|uniref:Stability/partitioning determinant n=1 Tax=Pseudomonas syringae pv. persicae TaxID=237306 RepID=A0AB38EP56_9PSED|nr:hypothetical protein ALQ45_200188 [Pseudomonas amygdali pv. morsprunorum]RMU36826.1 hypothetical protein ALP31_200221 [Pseudomonas amygdali pv. morsprunorum]SOQ15664.1 hypothetical protein CFBP1573P_05678 [Pseudomonas syringae pv. persicae]SOQ15817.1 hypothetical protein NCPPB2254_05647 [Pseudomonas syringae pv. persicae]
MVTLTQVVVKHLFGVNSHQYSLPAHDGNFWDSGLQPLAVLFDFTVKN